MPGIEESLVESIKGLGEIVRTVIYAVIIATVVRTLAYEPFNIPSESMLPTLLVGDYLFVSKFSYGYSRHSLPFSPDLWDGRVLADSPERGDVAVFKVKVTRGGPLSWFEKLMRLVGLLDEAERSVEYIDFIKRIIGLPGDRLQMIKGILHVNGEPVRRTRMDDYVYRDPLNKLHSVQRYRETLADGRSFTTLDLCPPEWSSAANARDIIMRLPFPLNRICVDAFFGDNTKEFVVPEGHFFMVGDNRDNSKDSRFELAYVPVENLVGRAEFLFFSTNGAADWWEVWKWPWAIRFSRLLNGIS